MAFGMSAEMGVRSGRHLGVPNNSDSLSAIASADEISGRAKAVGKAAEARVRGLTPRLEACVAAKSLKVSMALAIAVAGLALAGAAASGVVASIDTRIIDAGFAVLAAAAFAIAWFDEARRQDGRQKTGDLADQLATQRHLAVAARRLESALASNLRGEPSAESRAMMLVLLQWIESENGAADRRIRDEAKVAAVAPRRHERIVPRLIRTVVEVPDGRVLAARIVDVSLSGVAIETDLVGVTVGMQVRIGRHRARVVRKLARGLAFEFETPLDPARFDLDIVL